MGHISRLSLEENSQSERKPREFNCSGGLPTNTTGQYVGTTLRDAEESREKTKYPAGEKEQEFLISPVRDSQVPVHPVCPQLKRLQLSAALPLILRNGVAFVTALSAEEPDTHLLPPLPEQGPKRI